MITVWRNITWFFRRIKRVIDFIPHIWRGYDFDYRYAVDLFSYQLKRMADHLESNKSFTEGSADRAKEIRTAITLLQKVYDEEYGTEYLDKVEELYGSDALKIRFVELPSREGKEPLYEMKYEYESWKNAKEIKEMSHKLFKESFAKQEKAHNIVWKYIAHNIRSWWD